MNHSTYCNECGSNITEEGVCMLCYYGNPRKQYDQDIKPPTNYYAEGYTDGLKDQTVSSLTSKYLCGYRDGRNFRLNV